MPRCLPSTVRSAASSVVTLGLVSVALTACGGGEGSERLEAGQVVEIRSQAVGTPVEVRIPPAELTFVVSKPVETVVDATEVPATSSLADERRAPRGGRLVAVSWQMELPRDGSPTAMGVDSQVQPTVTLVVDGRDHPIEDFDWISRGSRVVAVDGEARRVEVRVTYDDGTQTVDVRQRRSDLEPQMRVVRPECPEWGDSVEGRGFNLLSGRCFATAYDGVPYVRGQGWAPEGQWFVVVDLGISASSGAYWTPDGGSLGVSYDLVGTAGTTVTLDGRRPVSSEIRFDDGDDDTMEAANRVVRHVFLAPEGDRSRDLVFARTYRLEVDRVELDGVTGYPRAPVLTYDGSIRLR